MRFTLILALLLHICEFNQFVQSRTGEDLTKDIQTTPMSRKSNNCPVGEITDDLTQEHFTNILTDACNYDKFSRPNSTGPTEMYVKADIKQIEILDQLQFKINIDMQYSYQDERLRYNEIAPNRGDTMGNAKLLEKMWMPHIVLNDERDTTLMGVDGKNVFISISPFGDVLYSYRLSAVIYCWMDLGKFPFDKQNCSVRFKSWTYNTSELILKWAEENPVNINPRLRLTEFAMIQNWTSSSTVPSGITRGTKGDQYSVLIFKFQISRQIGFYILDYFLPSIMLVCISWVSFWLQADNAAPRITLGTSTMLTFITLTSGQNKILPRVSYINASTIWFFGCAIFIFASIAEFAFVNIIWRRKKQVELKKASSKYILKSAVTPKLARRELDRTLDKYSPWKIHATQSLNSLSTLDSFDASETKKRENGMTYGNYLTIHEFPFNRRLKSSVSDDSLDRRSDSNCTSITITTSEENKEDPCQRLNSIWTTTITPQEIAIWIDKRSRLVFPLAFLVFNIIYWTFVYSL